MHSKVDLLTVAAKGHLLNIYDLSNDTYNTHGVTYLLEAMKLKLIIYFFPHLLLGMAFKLIETPPMPIFSTYTTFKKKSTKMSSDIYEKAASKILLLVIKLRILSSQCYEIKGNRFVNNLSKIIE